MEKEKQKQQGPISILNHIYVLQIHEKNKTKQQQQQQQQHRIIKGPGKTMDWWFLCY